jgi:predicted RNase H-like HicB family nuclease
METKKFVYYREDNVLIGWLEEYPDYRTQGETLEDLKENLKDIYRDIKADSIPSIRKIGELTV